MYHVLITGQISGVKQPSTVPSLDPMSQHQSSFWIRLLCPIGHLPCYSAHYFVSLECSLKIDLPAPLISCSLYLPYFGMTPRFFD